MKFRIIVFFILMIILASCNHHSRFYIKEFKEPVRVHIQRFDLDFMNLDTTDTETALKSLASKYAEFYPYFISDILHLNANDTTHNALLIKQFLSDSIYINVHRKELSICGDLSVEENLSKAFSYLHYYFPETGLPEIYAFTSGFNRQIFSSQNITAFGTDFYLGSDYELYPEVSHEYLIKNFKKEMLEVNVLSEVLHQKFKYGNDPENLLGYMLYEGKIMYMLEIILEGKSEENLIGYSTEENKWFKNHQKHIWTMLLEQKLLFSSSYDLINKFIQPAPFTTPVSQESPGRLGIRLGWEIIRAYMDNNPDITLPDLMKNCRYQSILEKSKFRP